MHDNYYYHRECVHIHDNQFTVESLEGGYERVVQSNGKATTNGPCPYPRIHTSKMKFDNVAKDPHGAPSAPKQLGYYSDWVAYAKTTTGSKNLFTFFNSTWKVPPTPSSRGPLGLSSIYLFNGLEDGAGHAGNASLILQPVLSYGKSGCILSPTNWGQWNLVSYLVSGSGRAHCGKRIKVEDGDDIVGTMIDRGNNNWEVDALHVQSNAKSSYVSKLLPEKTIDAAYITLEGMIIYNCDVFPKGTTTFFDNELRTASGRRRVIGESTLDAIEWTSIVKHSECKQNALVGQGSNVTIVYKSG